MTTGTQHTWSTVTTSIAGGKHTLVACEAETQTRKAQVVDVDRELWIVITFHSPPERFRVDVSEYPVAFM